MTCNPKTFQNSGMDAKTASQLSSYSGVVSYEITFLTDYIMKAVKESGNCSDNCLIVDNNTPMTYSGGIQQVRVLDGGENYYPVVPRPVIYGDGISAEIELLVSNGVIDGVGIIAGGAHYTSATIDIEDTYGTGAEFDVTIENGIIVDIQVINGGSGYDPIYPKIELDNYGNGQNANMLVSINLLNGSIAYVDVVESGTGYSHNTRARVVPPIFSDGTGAELDIIVNQGPIAKVDTGIYYEFLTGQSNRCGASNHINQIRSHFRRMGYNIRAMVNPKTNSSIMWEICWC